MYCYAKDFKLMDRLWILMGHFGILGASSIYIDFEFILGSKLNNIWKFFWGITPILIAGFAIWGLSTLSLTGLFFDDQLWQYLTGWSIVGVCLLIVIFAAIYEVYVQVDYNFMQVSSDHIRRVPEVMEVVLLQKLSSALKASRKWGPVDPMLRHGWIQWRSKSGQGDRDFTLRRRGTREYTRSVKHRKRQQQAETNLVGTRYLSTTNVSDSTMQRPSSSSLHSEMHETVPFEPLQNHNYPKVKHPLQVISITDTLERRESRVVPKVLKTKYDDKDRHNGRTMLNPLGVPSMYGDCGESNSEGYGTIRNGPFIISKDDFDHVCWRRASENATHL